MVECDRIQQEIDELAMKFVPCYVLKAEDMVKITDLMKALNDCKCSCDGEDTVLRIISFQFASITNTKDNIDLLTQEYLSLNGEVQTEASMLEGKDITLRNLGRYGFVIENSDANPFIIQDLFGNNITDTVFDNIYIPEERVNYYVSKEYSVPAEIYFKFIKQ